MLKQTSFSKKQKQLITHFNYYQKSITQSIHQTENINTVPPKYFTKDIGESTYHYIRSARDNISHFQIITQELLRNITKEIYQTTIQTNKTNGHNKQSKLNQKIQIFILSDKKQRNTNDSHISTSVKSSLKIISINSTINPPKQYYIFIVHTNLILQQWFYYVQRIALTHRSDSQSSFVYQAIFGHKKDNGLINYLLKPFFPEHKIIKYALIYQYKLSIFQSALIKQLKHLKIKNTKQYTKSHPQFKREDKLPVNEYKKYQKLKIQTYQFYSQINKSKKIKHHSIDNLICRFMKYKQYNYIESLKGIKYYLNWQKTMRQKYSWQSLQKFDPQKLYEIIGKDKQGRIILLFRSHLAFPHKVQNQQEFIEFSLYMLDLYIQDHTQGYIDDFILLADYRFFTSDNFKLSNARSVSEQSKELFPQRQFKLICFGLGSFSYFVYRIIKPFLPKFIQDKIAIFGTDKQELKQFLNQYININQLPQSILQQLQLTPQ